MVMPVYIKSGQHKAASLEHFGLDNMQPMKMKNRRNEVPRVFSTDKIDENQGILKRSPK